MAHGMWLLGATLVAGKTDNCWLAMHTLMLVLPHVVLPREPWAHAPLPWPTQCAARRPRLGGNWTFQAPAALLKQAQRLLDGCYDGPAEATRVLGPKRRRSLRRSLFLQELPCRDCDRTARATHRAAPGLRAPPTLSWKVLAETIVSALPPAQRL